MQEEITRLGIGGKGGGVAEGENSGMGASADPYWQQGRVALAPEAAGSAGERRAWVAAAASTAASNWRDAAGPPQAAEKRRRLEADSTGARTCPHVAGGTPQEPRVAARDEAGERGLRGSAGAYVLHQSHQRPHGDRDLGGTGPASGVPGGLQRVSAAATSQGAGSSSGLAAPGGADEGHEEDPEDHPTAEERFLGDDERRERERGRKRQLDEGHAAHPQSKMLRRIGDLPGDGGPLPPAEEVVEPVPAGETAAMERPYGRRYLGIQSDPVDAADSRGHALMVTGPVIWCNRCGRYAARRLGKALKATCPGTAEAAYATRLSRLRDGLHPLTGQPLV